MNKLIAIILTIVGICLVILIAVLIVVNKDKSHKQIEITKEINAGIPFRWEYTIEDPTIVECSKVYVLKDENKNGMVGAPIYRNYVFKGLKEGVTKVIFKFTSITNENDDGNEDVYTLKVDKDLNISLVVID